MNRTYRAVEVTHPGVLNLVQRTIPEPAPGQLRIRVEACGICSSDSATVDGILPGMTQEKVLTAQARQAVAKLAEARIAFPITMLNKTGVSSVSPPA